MICYNCKKNFIVKRNFLRLFETKKYYICDTCKKAYPINLKFEDIPLENYYVRIVSILDAVYRFQLNAYFWEISRIVERVTFLHQNYFFIFLEKFKLTDIQLEILSFLADTEQKPILLICCELKK